MKKILLVALFINIYGAESPGREHNTAKKKLEEILQKSPFKPTSQREFSSPNASKTVSRANDLLKRVQSTPSKSKEKFLALILATDLLPADEVRTLVTSASPQPSSTPPQNLILTLSDRFLHTAHSPSYSSRIQKRLKQDSKLTPRLKANLEELENISPGSKPRLLNTHHLVGEGFSGGHLFETLDDYTNNYINPTIAQTGSEPITNPENGVTVGFYQNQDSKKIKYSTVFPFGLSTEDIYRIMQSTKTIIHDKRDNKSLEIATLDNGTEIPIVVHHNKSGMLDQPFPVWTYKELGETIPGFTISRSQILDHAKEDYENPILNKNSSIAYENNDFIVYDIAKKLYSSDILEKSKIQKGALIKIDKSELR